MLTMSRMPSKFELSLDNASSITDKQLDRIAELTGARVLVDIIKGGRPGPGTAADHSKASWSYSS